MGEVPQQPMSSTRNSTGVPYAKNYGGKENNPANVFVNNRGKHINVTTTNNVNLDQNFLVNKNREKYTSQVIRRDNESGRGALLSSRTGNILNDRNIYVDSHQGNRSIPRRENFFGPEVETIFPRPNYVTQVKAQYSHNLITHNDHHECFLDQGKVNQPFRLRDGRCFKAQTTKIKCVRVQYILTKRQGRII